jgi:hypothetical protein
MGIAMAGWDHDAAAGGAEDGAAVLCTAADGHVVRCGCCGRLELSLGNLLLFLAETDLDAVREVLDGFDAEGPAAAGEGRPFVVRTEADSVAFALTRGEVREMREMVRQTTRALRRAAMLRRRRTAPRAARHDH